MMNEDAAQHLLSPYEYAEYLEKLSNDEFWNHARTLASHSAHPMQTFTPVTYPPDSTLICATCSLRDTCCVLPFTIIREILPVSQHITRLPDVPPWMIGILSWRGETIAAIDLCAYLTQKILPLPQERVTLIVQHEGMFLAFCILSFDATPTAIDISRVVPVSLPSIDESEESPPAHVGIVGVWEPGDTAQEKPLVLNIPLLFKDIIQHIERKAHYYV